MTAASIIQHEVCPLLRNLRQHQSAYDPQRIEPPYSLFLPPPRFCGCNFLLVETFFATNFGILALQRRHVLDFPKDERASD
jgi:hypothetical protein